MVRQHKPYRLNVELDPDLTEYVMLLGHGRKKELVDELLRLALSYQTAYALSYHQLIDLLRRSRYDNQTGT